MHTAPRQPVARKSADRRLQLRKLFAQAPQRLRIESRPDLARIHQLSPTVKADQQRSESDPTSFRIRITADDELLFLMALEFQPVARSSGDVHTGAIFCDNALPSLPARLSIIGFAFSFTMLCELQRALEVEGAAKHFLAILQRHLPRVVVPHVEQIEEIEPHRHLAEKVRRRVLDLHPLLKLREAGNPIFKRDDLAVRDERIGLLEVKRRRYLRVLIVQPLMVTRKEVQVAAVAKRKAAFPVPLGLKQPSFL